MLSYDVSLLVGAQKAEFDLASRLRSWLLRCQLALAFLSAMLVFVDDTTALYVGAIVAVTLALTWFMLNSLYLKRRAHAERLRRYTLILDSFQAAIAATSWKDLLDDCDSVRADWERLRDPDYFASSRPAGPLRFAENLEESAFWSATLSKYAQREMLCLYGVTAALGLIFLLAAVVLASKSALMTTVRVLSAGGLMVLSTDFLGSISAYNDVRTRARAVAAEVMQSAHADAEVIMLLEQFMNYNSVVENMPLFPAGL